MVLSQLQACGVLETVKISCAGYPTRWTYEEFASRYYMLIPSDEWLKSDVRDVGLKILQKCVPAEGHPREGQKDGKDKYQLGMGKIFFRAGMVSILSSGHMLMQLFANNIIVGIPGESADYPTKRMCGSHSKEPESQVLQTEVSSGP